MNLIVLIVFLFVYLGMILGRIPGLALDRTGVALLGAIVLLATGQVSPQEARDSVDLQTMGLLFGLMVVSAQFRMGGFYSRVTQRVASTPVPPVALLGLIVGVAGFLAALLSNDIICLAVAPVLTHACLRRRLNPLPFLLALACAANIGSAATLIGNPQNMLIGSALNLPFGHYLLDALAPSILSLLVTWGLVSWQFRDRWELPAPAAQAERAVEPAKLGAASSEPSALAGAATASDPAAVSALTDTGFDPWQTSKAVAILALLVIGFLLAPWPREVMALAAAGLLLLSRRTHSFRMLALVDWQLLVLFAGLFVVNHTLQSSGLLESALAWLGSTGVDPAQPAWLFMLTPVLSNLVSNVPAVMLLLPIAHHELAGPILALSSTLAGNLFIVGSIANIIVVQQAAPLGVTITWKDHARVGVPVTLATLAIAAVWLWLAA